MVDLHEASDAFAALGSSQRLAIVLTLVKAGPAGLATGDLQQRVAIPASTLSHHIKLLSATGLIHQKKQGRSIICQAALDRIEDLSDFLIRECCADAPQWNAATGVSQ